MFSKLLTSALIYAFCAALLVANSGCNLPLGEKPPEPVPPEAGFGDTECLEALVPALERYIEGTSSKAEVIATWNCMGNVVKRFEKSVSGRYEDRFTSRELANFIEQNFLGNKKIPDSTLIEVFKVKQLLVGGSARAISREEMGRFVKVIHQVRDIAVRLNPYMRIYSFHWKINGYATLETDVKYFETANLELQLAAKELASIIEVNGKSYEILSIFNLLKEVSQFSGTPWTWLGDLEKAIPLVQKLKKTLTGGSDHTVEPNEWRRFALLGGRGYIQYLRYYYFIKQVQSVGNGPELIYITRSIDDLFSYLGDMVDGKPEKTLTRHELLSILESLSSFIPNFHISDAFLIEVMKIKVLFFGGQIHQFVKADFDRAREKLEAFRTLTEKFLTYVSVYGLSWNVSEVPIEEGLIYHRQAEDNLTEFATKLGENLEATYDLKDLVKFAQEFDLLYPPKLNTKTLGELAKDYVPILISFKNVIFTDEDSIVGKVSAAISDSVEDVRKARVQHWSDFLSISSKLYSRYTYYYYFLRNEDMLQAPGLNYFSALFKDSASFLDTLIKRKPAAPTQQISFVEFNRIWKSLKDAKLLPEKISVKSLDHLTKVTMQKFLIPPEKRLMGDLPQGLSLMGVEQIRSEFALWLDNQIFMDTVYGGVPSDSGQMGSLILANLESAPGSVGLNELKMIYKTPVALSFDARGRMHIGNPELPYLRKTTHMINAVRAGVRMVIRSYAMDLNRTDLKTGGITLAEANSLFQDVQALVVELGFLDPRNVKFMENRFRDANLFTPWSNGDTILDFREGNDLVLMLLSGIEIDSLLYTELEKKCEIAKPSESKDDWTVSLGCVQEVYQRELPDKFSAMPTFNLFMLGLTPERYDEVFLNLLKAAGYTDKPGETVAIGDLALFPQVTQYVEVVFQKYDTNRDGFLDTKEALVAYPAFKDILKEAGGGKLKTDAQLKGLFTWLLKHAKQPETKLDLAKFYIWYKKGEKSWDVKADREKLVKILGFIADAVSKPPKDRIVIPDSLEP